MAACSSWTGDPHVSGCLAPQEKVSVPTGTRPTSSGAAGTDPARGVRAEIWGAGEGPAWLEVGSMQHSQPASILLLPQESAC